MHPVMFRMRRVGEKLFERDDKVFRVAQPASMKASGRREYDPEMVLTRRRPHASDPVEALHVLGYERPLSCGRESEKILVRHHC